jgi:putative endonuclease
VNLRPIGTTGKSVARRKIVSSEEQLLHTRIHVIARSEATKQSRIFLRSDWIASLTLAMTGEEKPHHHVIARSESDEAIQNLSAERLDCFAYTRNDGRRAATPPRHCEERSDEAIQNLSAERLDCFADARNDGEREIGYSPCLRCSLRQFVFPAMKQPCVYIVASQRNGTLYTGVTSNLPKRAFEHRNGLVKGFSSRYRCKMLIWYEPHETMIDAITREKQIKAGSRARKLLLIEELNPDWNDLYDTLI